MAFEFNRKRFADPIDCKLFPAVWSYNMEQHFRIQHPEFLSLNDPRLSRQFRRAIQITREEQLRLKIPEEFIVDCEALDEPDDVEEGSSGKRKRATELTTKRGKKKVSC